MSPVEIQLYPSNDRNKAPEILFASAGRSQDVHLIPPVTIRIFPNDSKTEGGALLEGQVQVVTIKKFKNERDTTGTILHSREPVTFRGPEIIEYSSVYYDARVRLRYVPPSKESRMGNFTRRA